MKCKYCGAPVTLEEEFCPYCGALNEPARAHIRAMRNYNADYQNTRQQVLRNAERQSRSHARIIVIAVLVVLNVVMIASQMNVEFFRDILEMRKIHSQAEIHRAAMAEYEEERNYAMLAKYYYRNSLYPEKTLREYSAVSDAASDYIRFTENLFYLTHEDVKNYQGQGELLQRMCQAVKSVHDCLSYKDRDYWAEQYTETHLNTILDIQSKMYMLLRTECGLTEEDIGKLEEMDSQSMMILVGRRMGIYE